jgi:hypothetical protein
MTLLRWKRQQPKGGTAMTIAKSTIDPKNPCAGTPPSPIMGVRRQMVSSRWLLERVRVIDAVDRGRLGDG